MQSSHHNKYPRTRHLRKTVIVLVVMVTIFQSSLQLLAEPGMILSSFTNLTEQSSEETEIQDLTMCRDNLSEADSGNCLTLDHEQKRRRIVMGAMAQWVNTKWISAKPDIDTDKNLNARAHFVNLMSKALVQREEDGFEATRAIKSEQLSNLIRRNIARMQNPLDCSSARFLYCQGGFGGFGGQVHRLLSCLLVAFGSHRTMIPSSGYDWIFQKFKLAGKTCGLHHELNRLKCKDLVQIAPSFNQKPVNSTLRILSDLTDYCKKESNDLSTYHYHEVLPQWNLPIDIADDLKLVSPDPVAWYISQFSGYILRPSRTLENFLNQVMNGTKLNAGMHVRRTDALELRTLQSVDKYIDAISTHMDILKATKQLKPNSKLHSPENDVAFAFGHKTILVATDEPKVLAELKKKYPTFRFESNDLFAESAKASEQQRITEELSVLGIIHDVYRLASADFVVCTFSSNVCRLVYELSLATKFPPPEAGHVISLDFAWNLGWDLDFVRKYVAVKDSYNFWHRANRYLSFKKGDVIHIDGSNWRFYHNVGLNVRTKREGEIDFAKVEPVFSVSSQYPSFTEITRT